MTVNIHQAKTHLSRLLAQVEKGEEITIARNGTVIARLVPASRGTPRKLGRLRGKVVVPNDFDTMSSAEIEDLFARSDP